MRKRKYEAKTGEEWLQHASRYLFEHYWLGRWKNENIKEAHRVITELIKKAGDEFVVYGNERD